MRNIFAEICKVNDEQRMVYGYASTEALDVQGEVVTKEAIAGALDEYMKFANIREMHQPSAVGVAKTAEIDDKGLLISAKVVDDTAWQKVKEGVYKGFSIGGKAISKVEGVIKSMRLSEISLVDRPANPEALITVWKADMDNQQSQENEQSQQSESVAAIDQLAEMLTKGEVTAERLIELAKAEQQPEAAAETGAEVSSGQNATETVEEQPSETPAEEQAAEKSAEAEGVAKGYEGEEVWDAAAALQALNTIQSLLMKERAEDEQMPEQIDALTAAVNGLKAFIVSEIQEDNSEKAEGTDDVAKAGRMISAANLEKLQAVHDACVGMGCKCDMGAKKSEEGEDIAKADMIAKVSELEADLQKMADENSVLKGEVESLKKQAAPGKALLKAVAVSKSDDQGDPEAEASGAPVIKDAHGNVNEAASLIKMIHQTGGAIAR